MRRIISKYVNLITISLTVLVFLISSLISYNNHVKAQDEFMKNSLSFLLYKENGENFLNTLHDFTISHKDISISYRDRQNDKVIFGTEKFDKDLYDRLKRGDNNKLLVSNLLNKTYYTYKIEGENTIILQKEEDTLEALNYFNIKYFFFIFMIIIFLNIFLVGKIMDEIMKPTKTYNSSKDLIYSRDLELINDLEEFFDKFKNDDVTKNDKENADLKARIFNFKSISDNMEEGFIYFNSQGSIEIINEAAKNMLGIDKNSDLENLFDNPEYKLALRETRLLSRGKNIDIKVGDKDIRLFIDPVFDDIDYSYIIIAIDDSENKKAENMRREFTANVTHELKSPLTSINGYAELIATGLAKKEDVENFAQIIYKEGNRLLQIIDDILKLSKLDEKSFEEGRKFVDIREVADSCITKYMSISNKKSLSIENKIEKIQIRTNESLFHDLISNLYENAIKYNKENGKILLESKEDQEKVYIMISDTGLGIKQENLNRIFERFFVADKARARNMKSTGLGLSIVKHICDYLNYDISVKSKLGEGSSFTISINK